MKKTIMIVEDEARIRKLISDYLLREDFKVIEASNGKEALEIFNTMNLDLIILDIMMPVLDGFSVCKEIRKISTVPIIILTARSEEDDELLGYDIGSDDYITKPFSPKVVVAKVKALLKRSDSKDTSQLNLLNFKDLTVNKLSHEVKLKEEIINLSPKEYDLLLYLIENKNIALSRENILNNVWGYDYDGDIRTVDTNIKRLREKLLQMSELIKTVRGSGYKFEI
ncbi:response regulator transcription factor [Clostridium sp.]|uniref:response regulator transcription factor n=1 Tax=Clostridium sp. TaxID=1506 RepID=UPI0034643A33